MLSTYNRKFFKLKELNLIKLYTLFVLQRNAKHVSTQTHIIQETRNTNTQ